MSKTLRELTVNAISLEEKIIEAEGVMTPELEEAFRISAENFSDKVDGYAMVMKRIEDGIEFHKQALKEHNKFIGQLEGSLAWMESNLISASQSLNKPILNGSVYSAKVSLNKASVDLLDDKIIPEDYKEAKVSYSISKTKIKEALDLGVEVPGARLIHKSKLTIGLRKKEIKD